MTIRKSVNCAIQSQKEVSSVISLESLGRTGGALYIAVREGRSYERASLAVQKANYAVKMYKNVGFRTVMRMPNNTLWCVNYENELIENLQREIAK